MIKRSLILGAILGAIISAIAVTHREPATVINRPAETYVEAETETVEHITLTATEPETETQIHKFYDFIPLSSELQTEIFNKCKDYDIDYELALAIIKTESEFIPDILGDEGNAVGLCQIWSKWWGDLATERGLNIYEPLDNVELMLIIMSGFLEDHTLTEALQLYNTGEPYGSNYASRVYANLTYIENQLDVSDEF